MGTELSGGRVLVVDDDRVNRMLLTRSLEREGHRVRCAENGAEALELLHDDPCDVVLLDIVMPGLDGVSVLERVKGDPALQDVPVIMISGVDDTESVVRCIEIGADDYLPKPFDPVLLRARISAGLTKKRLHELERERLRGVFARFVPEHVVDEVLERTDDDLLRRRLARGNRGRLSQWALCRSGGRLHGGFRLGCWSRRCVRHRGNRG